MSVPSLNHISTIHLIRLGNGSKMTLIMLVAYFTTLLMLVAYVNSPYLAYISLLVSF